MKCLATFLAGAALCVAADSKILLRQGWTIQSSAEVHDAGAALSAAGFRATSWHKATLPSTVFSALVADGTYPDPYFGMNLRSVPGTSYPIGVNFSNIAMPEGSPFGKSWWFRTEFRLPAEFRGKTAWLGFDGINFRANVWLNGKQVAAADQAAGAWRLFEFDVTAAAKAGETNSLAIEVFPPTPHDLAITFVDWNPLPPDKNMGVWRDVWMRATGPVEVRFPSVATHLAAGAAELTVRAELRNTTDRALEGTLKGTIEKTAFSQPVKLAPSETQVVHSKVKLESPRLWWPVQAGPQNLYPLDLQFETGGRVSDSTQIQFGVREVTSLLDDKGHRLFRINGKNILIRGGGYSFDMLLRSTPERQDDHLRYVRDLNLNAVRFEGKLEDDHFLDLADRYGILVLAGWCCCDHWEKWRDWNGEDRNVSVESLRDQLRRLGRHASVFDWLYGSDNPPPPEVEKAYLDVIRETEWPNPYQSSATAKPTAVTGPTGVKMTGPYEYVAPSYWYLDTKNGGAHGFNTETSVGPAPPPIESIQRMLPKEHWWPMDAWWDYHAGGGQFKTIKVFTEALSKRYGDAASLEDFSKKSQMMAYEGHRAMFEAYGRNKYTATGVIQWMLNNSWPGTIWHLYDWYMRPGGSYFGAKKACEPLHVQYSYDDRSVVVVNSYYQHFSNMKVVARVYNLDMTLKWSHDAGVDVAEDSSTRVFTIPEIAGLSPVWFVSLELQDPSDDPVSRNFYWLSTKPETIELEKSTWYHTPTKEFADYTVLNGLTPVEVEASAKAADGGTVVTVRNPSKSLAFAVHLKVKKGAGGEEVLPVLWEDNYFSLLPGQARRVMATYRPRDLGGARAVVEVDGWNVRSRVVQ